MKRRVTLIMGAILLSASSFAQLPQKISYQAVIRNSSNVLVANTQIGMEINIRQGIPTGTVVYTETQTPLTNSNGLVSIEIGGEAGFNTIDWANGPYFVETKTAIAPPLTTYTIVGTSQVLSVPYALHSETAEKITGTITEADPVFTNSQAVNITAGDIANLGNLSGTNTGDQDLSGLATTTTVTSALANKVDKVSGKGLSTEDFSTAEKSKLLGISPGAEANVQADWNQTTNTSDDYIKNKPANIDDNKNDDVTIAGNQTITGNKTFTGTTIVPDPVNASDAATKAYVDGLKKHIETLENAIIASGAYKMQDVDGNKYSVVKIGTQIWMAENLRTTRYADGTPISLVTDDNQWSDLLDSDKAYCYFDNDISKKTIYGALYTWAAAMNGAASSANIPSGIQGVCPTGWHLPSNGEWVIMQNYLADNGYNYDGTIGGGGAKIAKSLIIPSNWAHSTEVGAVGNSDYPEYINKSGFSAVPGGFRYYYGESVNLQVGTYWWGASESVNLEANSWCITYNASSLRGGWIRWKTEGFSVRCIKD